MSPALRYTGAVAILVNGIVHLYEIFEGPAADIDRLRTLFLVNVLAAAAITVGLVAWRSIVPVLAGIAFSVGSAIALLISRYSMSTAIDLFENPEPEWRTAMIITMLVEIVATAALTAWIIPWSKNRNRATPAS